MAEIGKVVVDVVPNIAGFRQALESELSDLANIGYTVTETCEFDYNEAGQVIRQTRATTVTRAI